MQGLNSQNPGSTFGVGNRSIQELKLICSIYIYTFSVTFEGSKSQLCSFGGALSISGPRLLVQEDGWSCLQRCALQKTRCARPDASRACQTPQLSPVPASSSSQPASLLHKYLQHCCISAGSLRHYGETLCPQVVFLTSRRFGIYSQLLVVIFFK